MIGVLLVARSNPRYALLAIYMYESSLQLTTVLSCSHTKCAQTTCSGMLQAIPFTVVAIIYSIEHVRNSHSFRMCTPTKTPGKDVYCLRRKVSVRNRNVTRGNLIM